MNRIFCSSGSAFCEPLKVTGHLYGITYKPEADFSALETGEKSLEDMAPQYYDGNRARRYMGMEGVSPA